MAAGCSVALALAKLLVHALICKLQRRFPAVRFQNLVDDDLLQALGSFEQEISQFPDALMELVQGFEAKKLKVNWGKLETWPVLASSRPA